MYPKSKVPNLASFSIILTLFFGMTLARAATVGTTGYTNEFLTQPSASDWAVTNRTGGGGDGYTMDTEVNAFANAALTIVPTTSAAPADTGAGSAVPIYHNTLRMLQTKPTGNRWSGLIGKFVNVTGTNATQIRIMYSRIIVADTTTTEEMGTRVYYSTTGTTWTNITGLNNTLTTSGSNFLDVTVSVPWPNGGSLYLLWADDNASSNLDPANRIDNFFLAVTDGTASPATISLTSPAAGQSFGSTMGASGTIPLSANASASGGATITGVAFYATNNGSVISLASDVTSPFSTSVVGLAAGNYGVFAVATNDLSGTITTVTSTTNVITVTNVPLQISLVSPTNGASYATLDNITVSVAADGATVQNVRFFINSGLSNTIALPGPYSYVQTPLAEGSYTVYAQVTDNNGTLNSATNTFTVIGPIPVGFNGISNHFEVVPPHSQWSSYYIPGAQNATRTDVDWAACMATNGAANITTPLPVKAAVAADNNAYYNSTLQRVVTQPTGAAGSMLMASLINKSGVNVANLSVSYTFRLESVIPSEVFRGQRIYWSQTGATNTWTPAGSGSNVLTAVGSSNVSFTIPLGTWAPNASLYIVWLDENGVSPDGDFSIDDITFAPVFVPPTVSILAPANGASFSAGANIGIQVDASDADGNVASVVLYTNGVVLTTLTTSPYNYNWNSVPAGNYELTAVATDNLGVQTVSAPANIPVISASGATVTITSPVNASSYAAGSSVELSASASGPVAITDLNIYTNAGLVVTTNVGGTGGAMSTNLTDLYAGTYLVYASAVDSFGTHYSGTNVITVTNTPIVASLTSPASGQNIGQGQLVILSATATSGLVPIAAIEFFTNGASAFIDAAPPFQTTASFTAIGNVSVYGRVIDAHGVVGHTATNTVTVTNIPVAISLTTPTNGAAFANVNPVTFAASASGPAVQGVQFYIDGGVSNVVGAPGPYTYNQAAYSLAAGSHTVYAMVTDSISGNKFSATNTFTIVGPIEVVTGGTINNFGTIPFRSQWFGFSVPGGAATDTDAQLDAFIATNSIAGMLANATNMLLTQATATAQQLPYWRSDLQRLVTQPTGNGATLIIAQLQNKTGDTVSELALNWTMADTIAVTGTQDAIRGHRVYVSKTGAENSWTVAGDFLVATPGTNTHSFTNFNLAWAPNEMLYIVWSDDNGATNPDGDFSVDDVTFVPKLSRPTLEFESVGTPNDFVRWDRNATGYVLEYTENLAPQGSSTWITIDPFNYIDDQFTYIHVPVDYTSVQRHYRLKKP